MKKLILTLIVFSLTALNPAHATTPLEAFQTLRKKLDAAHQEGQHYVAPNIFGLTHFSDGQFACTKDGYLSASSNHEEVASWYNLYSQSDINIKCFLQDPYTDQLVDTSDECILQRRNHKTPSRVCWFDYKNFLPEDSKIETDSEFMNLVYAAKFLLEGKYCQSAPELTTKEREECEDKAKEFIAQLSQKTAPHCRDTISEEYNKFLRTSNGLLTMVNNTSIKNGLGQEKQFETVMFQALYGGAFEQMALQGLRELGYKNFCTTEGFESDMQKIKGQDPLQGGRETIELN